MAARIHLFPALVAVVLIGATQPARAAHAINLQEFVMQVGDDPAWSDPTLDDADWQPTRLHDVSNPDSVVWLRTRVDLGPEHLAGAEVIGVYIAALASHEIWWDGRRIGGGGTVGASAEEERPGPIQAHYAIPDPLASIGTHRLAIRTSAFHRHFNPTVGYWTVLVGDYDRIGGVGSSHTRIALISLSGIVMMAIFALMMFLQDPRDRSFLFLGLLCLSGAALLVAESWRSLFGYTYDWHLYRLTLIAALSWSLDVFLLTFLARRFPLPGARWFVAAGVVAATVPIFASRAWDTKALVGFLWVFSFAAVWCVLASARRMRGGLLALLGVGCCLGLLLFQPFLFADRNLYLALDFLLICLLGSHVLQIRQERIEREAALLKSARLEIELLKRHLQPHFMMNTLTALQEWIEEQPQLATRMIQALSEEFRVLADISHRRLIPMADEIRLCRSHLEIMSHRKKREYRMTTEDVTADASIPPAVIHTLVENAITHNHYDMKQVEFRLSEDRREEFRRYVFTSPLGSGRGTEAPTEGTGLRYIRARLQESFGERFELRSQAEGDHWRTEILIPASA